MRPSFHLWDKENKKMLYYDKDIVPNMTINGVLIDEKGGNVSYKYDIILDEAFEEELTDMFGEGGKEEVKEYYDYRHFRHFGEKI